MRARGFTLIEVLLVAALAAILAALALPSYQQYVARGHRAHARAALIQVAQWMERAATVQGTYPLAADVPAGMLEVPGQRYRIELASEDGMAFHLRAVPVGVQASDACGTYWLDHTGRRGQHAPQTPNPPPDVRTCWER